MEGPLEEEEVGDEDDEEEPATLVLDGIIEDEEDEGNWTPVAELNEFKFVLNAI